MAPALPSKVPMARRPLVQHTNPLASSFSNSKRDKRTIKHNLLLKKIEKTRKPSHKKRRPSKKLATLQSLMEALPEDETRGGLNGKTQIVQAGHKSLRIKPGAMKQKEKIDRLERERFSKNMAQMAEQRVSTEESRECQPGQNTETEQIDANATRWSYLRKFLEKPMAIQNL